MRLIPIAVPWVLLGCVERHDPYVAEPPATAGCTGKLAAHDGVRGPVQWTETDSYDRRGRLILQAHADADGSTSTDSWTYDAFDLLVEQTQGDGSGVFFDERTTGVLGRPLQRVSADLTETWTYADGLLSAYATDGGVSVTYAYDDAGRLVEEDEDDDWGDGSWEAGRTTFEWGADGRIAGSTAWTDSNGATETDTDYLWIGDACVADSTTDDAEDGTVDRTREEDYDQQTRIVRFADHDGTGALLDQLVVGYDGSDVAWYSYEYGGGPPGGSSYAYDDDHHLLEQDDDQDGDGTIDRRFTWAYDAGGRPIVYDDDSDADGAIDARTVWTWTCL